MKAYNIFDEERSDLIGTLLYFEKDSSWIIELQQDLDEWTAPLLLTSYVKKHIYTIPRDISLLWVQERIIPSNRQNIQSILDTHHLPKYDERRFLEISSGRCSQDFFYIRKTKEIPSYVKERFKRNLTDCTLCSDYSLLCFFRDDTIRKVQLKDIPDDSGEIAKILRSSALFASAQITPGGYAVTFNNSIDLMAHELYTLGQPVPLQKEDFFSFLRNTILDTAEACELLECSRQNLAYLTRTEQLVPVRKEVRGTLYSKGDILKTRW